MRKAIYTALFLLIPLCMSAIPARRGIVTITQPDGTQFQARLQGDEFCHVMTDLSGHAIVKNTDGFYCYAFYDGEGNKCNSGFIVGQDAPGYVTAKSASIPYATIYRRSMEKRQRTDILRQEGGIAARKTVLTSSEAKAAPVKKHCIILLAQFSDVKMTYTRDNFENMINSDNYTYNGATGSAKKYFADQFMGEYEFEFTVGPLVTLSNKQAYYGGNDSSGSDKNAVGAVAEACRLAANNGVDFSQFDDDGDGTVDNVFLYVAGKDEAEGGGDDCIWSHQWYLSEGGINLTLNGKKIDNYAISTELSMVGRKFSFATIGTFCHEYSHTLGLMDMYDTDDTGSGGSANCLHGSTSLMDYGNYNNDGNTPPYYNAIDRNTLGIGQATTLSLGSCSLEPVQTNGKYMIMETGTDGEYFLFEYRNGEGWDKYVGGSGFAIYHIDKSTRNAGRSDTYSATLTAEERWIYNEVNCRPDHECADMISAKSTEGTSVAEVFFPYKGVDSFTATGTPSFSYWDGTLSSTAIKNIKISNGYATFTVSSDGDNIPNPSITEVDTYQNAATVSWTASDESYTGNAEISLKSNGTTILSAEVEPYEPGKYAYVLEGLTPGTNYTVTVDIKVNGISGSGQKETRPFATRALYKEGYPYIYLPNNDLIDAEGDADYSGSNIKGQRYGDGSFKKNAAIPLRIFNVQDYINISWFVDGKEVATGADGYYHLEKSCDLKAIITYSDGTTDVMYKKITVK